VSDSAAQRRQNCRDTCSGLVSSFVDDALVPCAAFEEKGMSGR
jgi:hypothetical protein